MTSAYKNKKTENEAKVATTQSDSNSARNTRSKLRATAHENNSTSPTTTVPQQERNKTTTITDMPAVKAQSGCLRQEYSDFDVQTTKANSASTITVPQEERKRL